MAKNQKDLAESLLTDDSPGWLTGFLADEDEMDRRALWRLASWGVGSVGAVIIAVMAHQSGLGLRHEQIAAADLARQSQQLQSMAKANENETRRLASAIDTLNGDRDRLFTRMTVLEQGLDSVTGSINRKNAAQSDPPETSSQAEAALSSPQAMPAPDNAPPSQATALPPAPVLASTPTTTTAAALTAIPSDGPKKSDRSRTGAPKAHTSKADSPKADLPNTDMPKAAESSATTSSSTPSSSTLSSPVVAPVASAAPAGTVVAKTPAAKPLPGKTSSADNSPPDRSQPAISASTTAPPATDMAAATPGPATAAATKPATVALESPSTPDKPAGTASDTLAKPEPEHDAKVQTKDSRIVVAALPAIADTEPPLPLPASVPVAHTDFGVDLGSARSIKGLRALWRGVLKSEAKELSSLHPIIVLKEHANGSGMQLRLVAGPLVDAAAAAKICAALSENGRTCETAVFDGQRLAMTEDTKANDPGATTKKPQSPHASRHRHSRRAARTQEPIPVPPPPSPPKPSAFSSFFSR
jgi:hypothetical protein